MPHLQDKCLQDEAAHGPKARGRPSFSQEGCLLEKASRGEEVEAPAQGLPTLRVQCRTAGQALEDASTLQLNAKHNTLGQLIAFISKAHEYCMKFGY